MVPRSCSLESEASHHECRTKATASLPRRGRASALGQAHRDPPTDTCTRSASTSSRIPRVLPQTGQKALSANSDERCQAGCSLSHVNALAAKCTNASAGAPECLRHISQWQITPRSGAATARYRIAPHRQPPSKLALSAIRLLRRRRTPHLSSCARRTRYPCWPTTMGVHRLFRRASRSADCSFS